MPGRTRSISPWVRATPSTEFSLDRTGPTPAGIGKDTSIPVVLALDYNPNPGLSVDAFLGATFEGELELEKAAGAVISTQNYDTAPMAGLAFRLRF